MGEQKKMKIEITIKLKDGATIKFDNYAIAIKSAREKSGLSQYKVAEVLNISRQHYQKYELGERTPKYDMLEKIATALNVDFAILMLTEQKEL
jgi:transcriptional regulator with XRE-family HTH domain